MFLLRRTAARAIATTPSSVAFVKPRSISSITPIALRARKQSWTVTAFQRRFLSDEPTKAEKVEAEQGFAQTAAEAPVEENLTPAQEDAQAEPTDAKSTVDMEEYSQDVQGDAPAQKPWVKRAQDKPPNNTLYVGNLYYEVSAEQLKRVFSRFGKVESVRIIYDNRGLSRGFGYVVFENIDEATVAIENLDTQVFEGRNLVVQYHQAKADAAARNTEGGFAPAPPSKTLFIGNMSFEMSDKDLNDLFRDIRNVMDVRVAIDRRTGQPRGFAHADFIDVQSATIAKDILSQKTVYGRNLRIDYSKSGTTQSQAKSGDRQKRF